VLVLGVSVGARVRDRVGVGVGVGVRVRVRVGVAPSACASVRRRSASIAAVSGFFGGAARLGSALGSSGGRTTRAAGAAGAAVGSGAGGAFCPLSGSAGATVALAAFSAALAALLRLLCDGSRGKSSRGPFDRRGVPAAACAAAFMMICILRGTALSQLAFLNSTCSGRKQFSSSARDTSFSRLRPASDRFGPLERGCLAVMLARALTRDGGEG
jgi:hypothetical protein